MAGALLSGCCRWSGASVLDVGAGTGFLSLIAAELGHHVDGRRPLIGDAGPAPSQRRRERHGSKVEIVEGEAASVPAGPFDAVISRHLLWTLLEPMTALRAWHEVAPHGRLVLVESLLGRSAGQQRGK